VNIDEASHGIHVAKAVDTGLRAAQPEDATQYPVTLRMLGGKLWRPDFTGRATADKYGATRLASANTSANTMPAERRATTALLLADTVGSGRHHVLAQQHLAVEQAQGLLADIDINMHGRQDAAAGACMPPATKSSSHSLTWSGDTVSPKSLLQMAVSELMPDMVKMVAPRAKCTRQNRSTGVRVGVAALSRCRKRLNTGP